MKNLWQDEDAKDFESSDLAMRVYTSRLLGQSDDLVLHGGGNTSVKSTATNLFGESEEILYVKGSGWDLKTIEEPGFSPARLTVSPSRNIKPLKLIRPLLYLTATRTNLHVNAQIF